MFSKNKKETNINSNRTRKRFLRKFKSLSLYRRKESLQSHAPLCDLPLELVELVASLLQPVDLGALRMTCKALYAKVFFAFWKASLQSIQTDLSCANLGKLETISRDAQLRHYVKHMVFAGFYKDLESFGEGYRWGSYRHSSGHLINLGDHPAIQRLSGILCQLANCKSFEIYVIYMNIRDQSDNDNFRATDSITALMDVVARAQLPVTALVVNFMDNMNYAPDPHRLQVSDREQFIAMGKHLRELKLIYELDEDIVRDWTIHLLLHTPKLHILHLKSPGASGYTEMFHRLALPGAPWPQLQELHIRCVSISATDLMVVLLGCQHSLRVFRIGVTRMNANIGDIKQMLRTLSTSFPVLESVLFDNISLGLTRRDSFIYFPVPAENHLAEAQGTFVFGTKYTRGSPDVACVAYSGPRMDVVLNILARTVFDTPSRNNIIGQRQ